jgi:hypothetical protein
MSTTMRWRFAHCPSTVWSLSVRALKLSLLPLACVLAGCQAGSPLESFGKPIPVGSCSRVTTVANLNQRKAKDMHEGEYGYVWALYSYKGKLYVFDHEDVATSGIRIQRVRGGFLADCSADVALVDDDNDLGDIPVIGSLQ